MLLIQNKDGQNTTWAKVSRIETALEKKHNRISKWSFIFSEVIKAYEYCLQNTEMM